MNSKVASIILNIPKILLPILLISNLSSQTLVSRIAVPIYLTTSISVGYDNNFLRLSDLEKENATFDSQLLGDSETFDSQIIRPEIKIVYNPVLLNGHITNIRLTMARLDYGQSSRKSYHSFIFRFEQHLGSYQWLILGYSLLPEYYLRTYKDRDLIGDDWLPCRFTGETAFVSYSFPVFKKTWVRIKPGLTNYYYDSHFTEFDTRVVDTEIRISTRLLSKFKMSVWSVVGKGDNITFNSGLISTAWDRSYDFLQFGTQIECSPKSYLSSIGGYVKFDRRNYLTDSPDDPLHAGRQHLEIKSGLWFKKELFNNISIKLSWEYREKITKSQYDWVEELKSFSKQEVWLKLSYDFYLDLFY